MRVFNLYSPLILSALLVLFSLCAYSQTEIWTAADLDDVRNNLDGDYIQMADIDLSGFDNWLPIGTEGSEFTGTYDGNGYTISNLTIDRSDMNYVGLFGRVLGSELKNITLIDVDITGWTWTGGLTGWSGGIIDNVSVTGDVQGNFSVGGIVGFNFESNIYDCRTGGSVSSGNSYVGGIVGYNRTGNVYTSYSTANISGNNYIGGLVGRSEPNALVTDSYATGSVNGNQYVGGLVGRNWHSSIVNSFATGSVTGNTDVGGLVGGEGGANPITINSYWDTETTGQTISAGGEGRTTDEMTYPYDEDTYVDWDFNEIWGEDTGYTINNGYPYLQWQYIPSPPTIVVEPDSFEIIVEEGETYNTTLNISNTGSDNLYVYIYNAGSTPDPENGGDVIINWDTELEFPWGTGFSTRDNTVWISDPLLDTELNHEFTIDGTPTTRTVAPDYDGVWEADMAFNHVSGTFWQVNVGGDNALYEFDPDTGPTGSVIHGPWTSAQRGVAYDPVTNTFFVGGWVEKIIYHIESDGSLIQQWTTDISISGLAVMNGYLYIMERTVTDAVTIFDIDEEEIIGSFTVDGFGGSSGVGLSPAGNKLWAANTTDDNAYMFESGLAVDWLILDTDTLVIPPSSEVVVDITIDATGLEIGGYFASISILNNDAGNPLVNIPVELTVIDELPLPDQVVLEYPEDGEVVEIEENEVIGMSWFPSQPQVTNYQLDIALDTDFTEIVFSSDEIADTVYEFGDWGDEVTYYWRVRAENETGWGEYSNVWSFMVILVGVDEKDLPAAYTLLQNYPNPFNPSTVIRYGLPERSAVRLEVYNALGQHVATLVDTELEAGYHEIEWYSGRVASGVYFYRLEAVSVENPSDRFVRVKSMIVLK